MNTINNGEETVTVSYNKSKSTNFPFIQKVYPTQKLNDQLRAAKKFMEK